MNLFFLFLLLTTWCHGRKAMLCDVLTPNKNKQKIYILYISVYEHAFYKHIQYITASSPLCATSIKKNKPIKTTKTQ